MMIRRYNRLASIRGFFIPTTIHRILIFEQLVEIIVSKLK